MICDSEQIGMLAGAGISPVAQIFNTARKIAGTGQLLYEEPIAWLIKGFLQMR